MAQAKYGADRLFVAAIQVWPPCSPSESVQKPLALVWYVACTAIWAVAAAGAVMDARLGNSTVRCGGIQSAGMSTDSSLAWYKVVGIEFFLFAAILAPVVCGALLAR